MKFKNYLLILTAISIIYSCNQSTEKNEKQETAENIESIKKIIDKKNAQLEAWYKAGLADSVASYFSSNTIQMVPNQKPTIGNDMFKESWKESMKLGQWKFTLKAEEVKHSGNLAVELGKYTLDFTPNESAPIPAMSDQGNYIVLWEKINGDWKIVWDAPVSELPIAIQNSETDIK